MRTTAFFVEGHPLGQGSMRSFRHHTTGRMITLHNKDKSVKGWRTCIALTAKQCWPHPTYNAYAVTLTFHFKRFASHYTAKRRLTANAPPHPTSHRVGDLDKHVRACLDGLTNVIWYDDAQVVTLHTHKCWTDGLEGVNIMIEVLP
jgi:crossover junction endodeoxyribonuclease RusA